MTESTRPLSLEQRHLAEIEGLQRGFDTAESQWEQAKEAAGAWRRWPRNSSGRRASFWRSSPTTAVRGRTS
jgi:hypothetical protein